MNEHHERIPLTAHVLLPVQEVGNQLRCVGDEKVKVLVDGEDGEDRVPPDIAVPVLQAGADGRHQRLQQLRLLQLAQKPVEKNDFSFQSYTSKKSGVINIFRA